MNRQEDVHDLQRFVLAQDPVLDRVSAELAAGRKQSHWMWFVFPQLRGLGHSAMAERYGIGTLDEAAAYVRHPVLGSRLARCTQQVLDVAGKNALQIFGTPDDRKFHSSMTLFAHVDGASRVFRVAIDRYFNGRFDAGTLRLLDVERR